jgi:hypothetical protein
VDWEHSGSGDPAWDLGSALAAYVTFWLASIVPAVDADAARLAAAARYPLREMWPAMAALWSSYLATGEADAGRRELRRRTSAHCGARLVQTALEEAAHRDRTSGLARLHVQVAENILSDPERAATDLLGLDADG